MKELEKYIDTVFIDDIEDLKLSMESMCDIKLSEQDIKKFIDDGYLIKPLKNNDGIGLIYFNRKIYPMIVFDNDIINNMDVRLFYYFNYLIENTSDINTRCMYETLFTYLKISLQKRRSDYMKQLNKLSNLV